MGQAPIQIPHFISSPMTMMKSDCLFSYPILKPIKRFSNRLRKGAVYKSLLGLQTEKALQSHRSLLGSYSFVAFRTLMAFAFSLCSKAIVNEGLEI